MQFPIARPHSPRSAPSWTHPAASGQGTPAPWRGHVGALHELLPSWPVQSLWPWLLCPHWGTISAGLCVAECWASLNEAFVGESRRGRLQPRFFHVPPARVN